MKISNEAKVGVIGVATIAVLIWGINYLKGRNIFNSNYTLTTFYEEAAGLEKSAPVLFNGIKVGFIDDLKLRTEESPSIKVVMRIEKQYRFGEGSMAELINADLFGTKAIGIVASGKETLMQDHDTLQGVVEQDLLSGLQSKLFPILDKADRLAESLDSLSGQLEKIVSQDALINIIENLADLSYDLKTSLADGGVLDKSFKNLESFTGALEEEKEDMVGLISNLHSVSESLDRAGLDTLSTEMTSVLFQLNSLLDQVNSGEGTAGKLFYSDTLHESLAVLVADMDSLVRDLTENPGDYVQVSVFGKSKK